MSWRHPFLADPGRPLILASASPRRADILRAQGLAFSIRPASIDEAVRPGEPSGEHVERLALEKARAVAADAPGSVVLGCDTIVVIDEEILGKPADRAEAIAMLGRLSGREHVVHSSAALVCRATGQSAVAHSTTQVRFRELSREEIEAYVDSGEPMDKAGAWGIQGTGAMLVEHIDGGYFTVMGLPVGCLRELWTKLFGPPARTGAIR
jgi:septum formation protein